MTTTVSDPDRQTRLVWLMLAVLGAVMAVIGWSEVLSALRLLR